MAQPQAYNRETDFTERDGDDTNHAGINTELDAAALSINELRDNLALIQRDDGALKNGIVTAESLSDSAFNAVLGEVATATAAASASADRSTLFATQAEADRIAAQAAAAAAQSSQTAAATSATAAASSQTAAANSATSASTSASTATTKASEASTSASNAATSATSASTSASTATTKASEAATSATSAASSATTATTQAGIATTQASNAAASATAAAASFDDFEDRYLGPKSAAPTTDNDGNLLQTGALYFDTNGQGEMRVWNGTIWKAAGSAVNGTTNRATYTATAGQTTFAIVYDVGFVDVYLNGLKLQAVAEFTATNGTSIVLASGATAGDIVDIVSYGVFSVANIEANDVSFTQPGTGAVLRTAHDKLQEFISRGDYNSDANYDSARIAKTGRNDLVVRPSSSASDVLLSDALGFSAVLQIGRTAPHANFNWFTSDFTIAGCPGTGRAVVVQDLADVFQTKFGALIGGAISYVHPSGSDANGGNSWRHAFLTLAQALRNTTNGTIYIWPGTYDLSDFRYTDSYGGQPKKIIAPYGGVVLRVAGDDPSAATWTLNGDYGGVYQMHVASSNNPTRLLRKDLLDKYGEPTPMPYFSALVGGLGSNNFGWAFDPAYTAAITGNTTSGSNVLSGVNNAKSAAVGMSITGSGIPAGTTITAVVPGTSITMSANATATATGITTTVTGRALYVREAMSANVNTTTKANIQVIYGDNRTLLYSTTSYWENITFLGYISVLKVAGQAVPQFWAKKCTFKYGATHAILAEGGHSYTQDCRAYRMTADGANYNTTNGTTSQGVEINFTTQFAGDVDTYGTAQTANPQGNGQNKNGSSNHSGYVVRVNGIHLDPFGPNIADTATSYSWNLGVQAGYSQLTVNGIPSVPRYGILNQGNNAWLDGCAATGNDAGFNSDSSANVRVFNCFGTQAATASGTFTAYIPK